MRRCTWRVCLPRLNVKYLSQRLLEKNTQLTFLPPPCFGFVKPSRLQCPSRTRFPTRWSDCTVFGIVSDEGIRLDVRTSDVWPCASGRLEWMLHWVHVPHLFPYTFQEVEKRIAHQRNSLNANTGWHLLCARHCCTKGNCLNSFAFPTLSEGDTITIFHSPLPISNISVIRRSLQTLIACQSLIGDIFSYYDIK